MDFQKKAEEVWLALENEECADWISMTSLEDRRAKIIIVALEQAYKAGVEAMRDSMLQHMTPADRFVMDAFVKTLATLLISKSEEVKP